MATFFSAKNFELVTKALVSQQQMLPQNQEAVKQNVVQPTAVVKESKLAQAKQPETKG